MAIIKNSDIIQPALITRAKYSFTVIEKRIMYRILLIMQKYINGEKLDKDYKLDVNIFNDWDITLPTKAFLKHSDDKNYHVIRKNLLSLNQKVIELKTENTWEAYNIIERPQVKDIKNISVNDAYISFRLAPKIVDGLFNYAKGFTKYELKVAFELESEYSMRFYELVSEQKNKPFLDYKIDTLKEYFSIEDKYLRANGTTHIGVMTKKVIEPAKKELDACSPWTFEYQFLDVHQQIIPPKNKRSKRVYIRIYPKYQPQFRDENLEKEKVQKQTSLRWDLSPAIIEYLRNIFEFTTEEIKNNRDVFIKAQSEFDLLQFMALNQRKACDAKNPKGYIIQCIKNKIKE